MPGPLPLPKGADVPSAAVVRTSHHSREASHDSHPRPVNVLDSTHTKKIATPSKKNTKWVSNSALRDGSWLTEQQKREQVNDHWGPYGSDAWAAAIDDVPQQNAMGYSLHNYDGSWAPPPEDWDSRPAFGNLQSAESIKAWIEGLRFDPQPLKFARVEQASTNFSQAVP